MPEPDPRSLSTFGQLLRHLRQRARLTQDEFGVAVGYSRAHVARLESSQRVPNAAVVQARFVEVLHLQSDPALAARLIALAATAHAQPANDSLAEPEPELVQRPSNNLPTPLTSFIGREKEIVEITQLLSQARLVTLTGAGGVGKTRLALQLAAGIMHAYPDGVWLVELAALADPALVPQAVAAVLGVREEPGRLMLATLLDRLRGQELLLLLDNCEHLIEAVAHLTDALLRDCHAVRILATSRLRLGITGEQAWRVPTLHTPEPHRQIGLAELAPVEAVRLFVERAALMSPAFALTAENASAVRQISARLDGIPLAIELAAARVDVLSVEDIATRLDDRFRLLTGGSRTALPRQQTLRSTIDWSYELLSAPERILFRRLAVFAGGWTLEAAETVCAGDGIESVDVLGLLGRLVDQSLVVAVMSAGVAGLTRYHFLETIRQYAFEKLVDAGEEAHVRERHLAYFISLGEAVAIQWSSATPGDQASQARRLELDFDNVRSALDWTAECGRVDDGIHLIEAFYDNLFFVRPLDQELLRQLQRLTAHPAAQRSVRVAWAYMIMGTIYFDQDRLEQAEAANEQAREIGLALGGAGILSQTSFRSALLAQERGDFALARSIFDRLVAASEDMHEDWSMHYGVLALYEQDYPQAHEALARLYALCHADAPDKLATSGSARMLGYALTYQGDFAEAASKLRESVVDNWEMRDERAVAACLAAFGVLAVAQTDLARGARHFGASEALIEAIHDTLQYFDRVHVRRNVAALRARMDEATLSAEWAVGRAMTPAQAVEYALSEAS